MHRTVCTLAVHASDDLALYVLIVLAVQDRPMDNVSRLHTDTEHILHVSILDRVVALN